MGGPFDRKCFIKLFYKQAQASCPLCRALIYRGDYQTCWDKFSAMVLQALTSNLLYAALDAVVPTLLGVLFTFSAKFELDRLVLPILISVLHFAQICAKYRHYWGGILGECEHSESLLTYNVKFFHENEEVYFCWTAICRYGKAYRSLFIAIGLIEVSMLSYLLHSFSHPAAGEFI